MLRDRSSAPNTSFPFRPMYHLPARNSNPIGSFWYQPRGIHMYYRFEVRRAGTVIVPFGNWEDATQGLWTGNGTIANGSASTETVTVNLEIAGRVTAYDHIYTIRKISSGGVVTEETGILSVTGPGSYSISWTAAANGTARMDLSGNKFQFNIPDGS